MRRENAAIIKKWYRFGKRSDREDSPCAGERPPDGLKTTDDVLEVANQLLEGKGRSTGRHGGLFLFTKSGTRRNRKKGDLCSM